MTNQKQNKDTAKHSAAYIRAEEIARTSCYWRGYMTEEQEREFERDVLGKKSSKNNK